jgi:hypothetical protein
VAARFGVSLQSVLAADIPENSATHHDGHVRLVGTEQPLITDNVQS